jgi:L-alanine-DL-glutamate epimerase-like enolase superfamily enzyme
MTFQIEAIRFHVLPMRTRFPFQYGIASLTALPHLFVSAELQVNGQILTGIASEGLPPKWFTKDPHSSFEQDLAVMLSVIQNAARIGRHAASKPLGFFPWWRALYDEQSLWASHQGIPPLLAQLGISLVERAVLDALCRAAAKPLHQLLKADVFGIDLGSLRAELSGLPTHAALAEQPMNRVHLRHTIGLADPLSASDLQPVDAVQDGLPQTLEDSIRAYGLRWFKIKLGSNADINRERLLRLAQLLEKECGEVFSCTLDGNEQFTSMAAFCDFYAELSAITALQPLLRRVVVIEQPVHRAHALDAGVAEALSHFNGPRVIIDESDGSLTDLPRALTLGYCGTSHKNCKGIVKSLANAALLRKRAEQGLPAVLTGEDLASVGPVAMLKDLALAAALGITHVERNGHHYFRGLAMFSAQLQEQTLRHHGELYQRSEQGYATLSIRDGVIDVQSLNEAPFGNAFQPDLSPFESLNDWIKRGGMSEL